MDKKDRIRVNLLFAARVVLWITALASTVYWIWFSVKLTADGIRDPLEYGTALRPVLYTGVIIAVVAIAISYYLYAQGKKIKDRYKFSAVTKEPVTTDDTEKTEK